MQKANTQACSFKLLYNRIIVRSDAVADKGDSYKP